MRTEGLSMSPLFDPGRARVQEVGGMQGYGMKGREKRDVKDAQPVTLKNGRAATQGACSVCGTKITVLGAGKAGGR
jgi:uncharacterized protein DUF5679